MTPEHTKAKHWREARNLSVAQLAELTGYSEKSIYWYERGITPPLNGKNRPIQPWVWQRYKAACAGADRQLRTKQAFDW